MQLSYSIKRIQQPCIKWIYMVKEKKLKLVLNLYVIHGDHVCDIPPTPHPYTPLDYSQEA